VQRPRKREERNEKKKEMVIGDKPMNLSMHAPLFIENMLRCIRSNPKTTILAS
jgi:hypothetical protein